MTPLQRKALAGVALSEPTVESFYDGSRSGTAEQCLKALCVSHERLRAELRGAEALLTEREPPAPGPVESCPHVRESALVRRLTLVGPQSERQALFDLLLATPGWRAVRSGPYTDREMWPEVDTERFLIVVEREIME